MKAIVQSINKYLPEKIKLKLAKVYSALPFSLPRIAFTPLLECNYTCTYCFSRKYINPYFSAYTQRNYTEWIALFNKFPTALVTVGGGEPLVYKDIDTILKFV